MPSLSGHQTTEQTRKRSGACRRHAPTPNSWKSLLPQRATHRWAATLSCCCLGSFSFHTVLSLHLLDGSVLTSFGIVSGQEIHMLVQRAAVEGLRDMLKCLSALCGETVVIPLPTSGDKQCQTWHAPIVRLWSGPTPNLA